MLSEPQSPFLQLLRDRVDLQDIPLSERGSRLLVFKRDSRLFIKLAERWAQWENQVGHYRLRAARLFGWSSAIFVELAIQASRGKIIE